MTENSGLTYRDAGVDIEAATGALARARDAISRTQGEGCVGGIGGFGGLFRLPTGLDRPLLCASTDGVGTKIQVAVQADRHDTVGQDLTNHCVNDILVQGARPLFLLDYVASGKLRPNVVEDVIRGFAQACEEHGMALLGGETAEMPGTYRDGEYDLAATVVGVVEEAHVYPRPGVKAGDVLIGLPSNGLHTNGYSLARKALFERGGFTVDSAPEELDGQTVGEALLAVHRSYAHLLLPLLPDLPVKALAHITGGGFPDNLPRVLPNDVDALVDATTWEPLPIFELIRSCGDVPRAECYRAFNMGMGMVLVTPAGDADDVVATLRAAGETGARVIGELVAGQGTARVGFGS